MLCVLTVGDTSDYQGTERETDHPSGITRMYSRVLLRKVASAAAESSSSAAARTRVLHRQTHGSGQPLVGKAATGVASSSSTSRGMVTRAAVSSGGAIGPRREVSLVTVAGMWFVTCVSSCKLWRGSRCSPPQPGFFAVGVLSSSPLTKYFTNCD